VHLFLLYLLLFFFFFFFFFSSRRRHTRWPRDWSSDVCSSDLRAERSRVLELQGRGIQRSTPLCASDWKLKSAICSLCWSTSPVIWRSIRSPRFARQIASSSAAFNGWRNN